MELKLVGFLYQCNLFSVRQTSFLGQQYNRLLQLILSLCHHVSGMIRMMLSRIHKTHYKWDYFYFSAMAQNDYMMMFDHHLNPAIRCLPIRPSVHSARRELSSEFTLSVQSGVLTREQVWDKNQIIQIFCGGSSSSNLFRFKKMLILKVTVVDFCEFVNQSI